MKAIVTAVVVVGAVMVAGCSGASPADSSTASPTRSTATTSSSPTDTSAAAQLPAHVLAWIKVNDAPDGLDAAFGSLWVTAHHGDSVQRIDPTTDKVTATINLGAAPTSVWHGFGAEFVLDYEDQLAWRIDPRTNRARSFSIGGYGDGDGAAGLGAIWLSVDQGGDSPSKIQRIDPVTLRVTKTLTQCTFNCELTIAHGLLWVGSHQTLSTYDPASGRWRLLTTHGTAYGQGIGATTAYVTGGTDAPDLPVTAVSTRTGHVGLAVRALAGPQALADGSHVWVVNHFGGGIGQIQLLNPKSGQMTLYTDLVSEADGFGASIVAFGSLWYSDWNGSGVYRIAEPT